MSSARKGFSKVPRVLQDLPFTRDEAAIYFHLSLRKSWEPKVVEIKPGTARQLPRFTCEISVRALAEISGVPRSSVYRAVKRLEARGLLQVLSSGRSEAMAIRLPDETELETSQTIMRQLTLALSRGTKGDYFDKGVSTGTVVGQHGGTRQNDDTEPKMALFGGFSDLCGTAVGTLDLKTRSNTIERAVTRRFVDNFETHRSRFNELRAMRERRKGYQGGSDRTYGVWCSGNLALATHQEAPELGLPNIYCQHSSIKADENIPNRESCPEEDPHRLDMPEAEAIEYLRSWPLPKREDFQLRITWYHLERWCSRWAGAKLAFQNPQTRRARQINESQAARELRDQVVGSRHWTSVEIAAAKRDVERNGMIGSCAWEDPPEGVYRYLVDHMPAVLSRLERQSGERARRARGAAEGRRARQAARFNLKVRAFTAAYPDRPGRRKEIDRIRETYPVIFREIPRAGIEELAVAAALWNGSEVRCVRR